MGTNGENPMLKMPFMDPRIIDNPFRNADSQSSYGVRKFSRICRMDATRTRPGGDIQWIHRDSGQLFPELPFALPVFNNRC